MDPSSAFLLVVDWFVAFACVNCAVIAANMADTLDIRSALVTFSMLGSVSRWTIPDHGEVASFMMSDSVFSHRGNPFGCIHYYIVAGRGRIWLPVLECALEGLMNNYAIVTDHI